MVGGSPAVVQSGGKARGGNHPKLWEKSLEIWLANAKVDVDNFDFCRMARFECQQLVGLGGVYLVSKRHL